MNLDSEETIKETDEHSDFTQLGKWYKWSPDQRQKILDFQVVVCTKAILFNYISNDLIISALSRTEKDSEIISHIQRMTRDDWKNK